MNLQVIIPTTHPPSEWASQGVIPAGTVHWVPGQDGLLAALQRGYEECQDPVLAYLHDDVTIHDGDWAERVLAEFQDPTIGVVGFGGALIHGHPDLYRKPYELTQLARFGYLSNMDDAEAHGQRLTGTCDVAVLDGFALIMRRALLAAVGGWPVNQMVFHCYDYWLCCTAHRLGYRVRLVGVRCHHAGGMTSTKPAYQDWLASRGLTDAQTHEESHRYIYDGFQDVLPWACSQPDGQV